MRMYVNILVCQIVAENEDSSICAHVPRSWIKIIPSRQLSEEQRREISYRLNGK